MKRPASAVLSSSDRTERPTSCSSAERPLLHCAVSFPLLFQATLAVLHSLLLPPVVAAPLLQAALVTLNSLLMSLVDPVVLNGLLMSLPDPVVLNSLLLHPI